MSKMSLQDLLNPQKQNEVLKTLKSKPKGSYTKDETVYRCERADTQDNVAEILLLPNPYTHEEDGVEVPYHRVRYHHHWFDEGNQKVYEVCPSKTNNELHDNWDVKCPICEYNKEMYPYRDTETPSEQSERNLRKAKNAGFYCNIYVLSDALHPENAGKVFKMKLPWQIVDKVESMVDGIVDPNDDNRYSVPPFNPLSFQVTKPIRLIARPHAKNKKWNDFADSEFLEKGNFSDIVGKENVNAIFESCYDLYEDILAPALKKMKTYDELSAVIDGLYGTDMSDRKETTEKFNKDLGDKIKSSSKEDEVDDMPDFDQPKTTKTIQPKKSEVPSQQAEDFSDAIPDFDPNTFKS